MTGHDESDGMPIEVSVPDALCGNVGDTVPLVRYDSAGRRTVIGVATVTGVTVNDDGTVSLTVDASTTARDLVEKGMPKAAPEFSLGRVGIGHQPKFAPVVTISGPVQSAHPDGAVRIVRMPYGWRG